MRHGLLVALGAISLLIPLVEDASAQQRQGYRSGGGYAQAGRGAYGGYSGRGYYGQGYAARGYGQTYRGGGAYGARGNVNNSFNGNTLNRNVYVKNNGWGGGNGAAIAAGAVGLIGGLALGAAVSPAYGAYGAAYPAYAPMPYTAVPASGCYIQNVPGPYGSLQPVRVCYNGNGGSYYVQPY